MLTKFIFKRLIFLVRDWMCPGEFAYGDVGGKAYVQKQLKVGKLFKEKYCELI